MSTSHLTALVVDDEVIPRRMMAFALQGAGFDCSHALNGNDAIEQVSEKDFDLVVTDLKMPGCNGCSLVNELLSRIPLPLIAVHTSVDDARLTKELMSRGVDEVVYKPTNYSAFASKMKDLASRRSMGPTPIAFELILPHVGEGARQRINKRDFDGLAALRNGARGTQHENPGSDTTQGKSKGVFKRTIHQETPVIKIGQQQRSIDALRVAFFRGKMPRD